MSRLIYRDVGRKGQRYPGWLRKLRKYSGVYVIRRKASKQILYVGESHSGRLYGTITRHFQVWNRNVNQYDLYWGRETGKVYERGGVEVAFLTCRRDRAPQRQFELIQRLKPRDNEVTGDAEEVPF